MAGQTAAYADGPGRVVDIPYPDSAPATARGKQRAVRAVAQSPHKTERAVGALSQGRRHRGQVPIDDPALRVARHRVFAIWGEGDAGDRRLMLRRRGPRRQRPRARGHIPPQYVGRLALAD